jgi:hypothetical protein
MVLSSVWGDLDVQTKVGPLEEIHFAELLLQKFGKMGVLL